MSPLSYLTAEDRARYGLPPTADGGPPTQNDDALRAATGKASEAKGKERQDLSIAAAEESGNWDEPTFSAATADEFDAVVIDQAVRVIASAAASASREGSATLRATFFQHAQRTDGVEELFNWPALCRKITKPGEFDSKKSCPLFRLATSKGASRAAGTPVDQVFGLVGDYDAEEVSVDEAAQRLRAAGVQALLYTSASHRRESPRWRVVAPLARPISVDRYAGLMDELNGALGGILARESWEVTRCYYYGRVQGVQFEPHVIDGDPLDIVVLASDFEPIGQPAPHEGAPMRATKPRAAAGTDDLERRITLNQVTEQTLDDLRDALGSIRADDRKVWVDMGIALSSLKDTPFADAAQDAWVTWSRTSAAFLDGDEAQWDTFTANEATYRKVFGVAEEHGWKNPAKATLETERERSVRIGREGEHQVPTQRVMSGSEMIEELVFVADGSRVAFLHEPRFALPFTEFKNFTAASVEKVKGPKNTTRKVHRTALWLESADRKTVRTQTFAPGRGAICDSPEGDSALNMWRARSATAPANWAEITAPFFDHVTYLVPNEAERERFLDWLAHIEQAPGVLPHTHYLLVTKQTGIGRNWLAYALARCFAGYTALGFDLAESLRTGFNGALSQRLLAVVDELHEGGPGGATRAGAEKLKSLLTESTRRINPKYGRQHTEFNACRFLMFSNHEDALPLAENDRRVVVIENPSDRRGADYYSRLYRLLDDPGLGAALAEAFRQRDISRFNPGEIAPMSAAKARTIRAGRSEMEAAVRDIAAEWASDCITSSRLQIAVSDALGGRVGSTQGACVSAGLVKYAGRVKVAGVPQHIWILRDALKWANVRPAEVAAEVLRAEDAIDRELFA